MSKEKEFRIETIDKTIKMLNNIKSRISYIDNKKAELEKVKEREKQKEKKKMTKTNYEKELEKTKKEIEEKVVINKGWTEELINNYNLVCSREDGYKKGKEEERERMKKLKQELLKASEDNDWDYTHNDGYEDGFRVMDGKEFIENKFKEKKKNE